MLITELAKKIASNTLYQMIGKLVTMAVTIAVTVIVTRLYDREGYGLFNIMQVFPALFFVIVDFGFNAIATRELSKNTDRAQTFIGNIILMRLAFSAILIALCVLALQFFPYSPQLRLGIYMSLFLIVTQAMVATTNIIFQVKLRYDYSMWSLVLGSTAVLALVLGLARVGADIVWLSFSYVIGGLVTFAAGWYFVRRLGVQVHLKFDASTCAFLLAQALPIGLMFVFSQINFKADSIMLSVLELPKSIGLGNTESVALYGLPYKIFEVLLVVPTFFMNAAYPVFVRKMTEGQPFLKNVFFKSTGVLLGLGVLVSLVGIVTAPVAVDLLGGEQFAQSALVLRLLLIGMPIFYATQPIAWLLVTLDKQKHLPYIYLVAAVFNVSMNYLFITKYSFYASAIITWVSELLILVLLIAAAGKAWKAKYA